jgi:hypothetical protein
MSDYRPTTEFEPYPERRSNRFYNLLFCDIPGAYLSWSKGAIQPLFARNFDEKAVRSIAEDRQAESRMRALAYGRLRTEGRAVPEGVVLGVIVETPLPRGLDTLATYIDGRVRYINGTGARATIERDLPSLRRSRAALFKAAQDVVDEMQPSPDLRAPPPKLGNVRITSLASDGNYVGEANLEALTSDPLGGPILRATTELLEAVLEYSKTNKRR